MAEDSGLGPVLLSVRHVEGGATRLLVRLRSGTKHKLVPEALPPDATPAHLAKVNWYFFTFYFTGEFDYLIISISF
jgi:hypothetical protein